MRNILSILVVVLFVLSGFGAVATPVDQLQKTITETVSISKPVLIEEEKYVQIDLLESDLNLIESGKPLLPKITKTYTFPFGTKITDVQVKFSDESIETVSKPIVPSPEAVIVSSIHKQKTETKTVSYSDIKTYPENKYIFRKGAGLDNGNHVIFLTVNIFPIQYTPATNTLSFSKTADVTIKYEIPSEPIKFGDDYDLLIIAPAQFEDELQPLVDYKNGDGTDTILVTLEDIPDTGLDEQESIKYYIKDAIETMGITHLLLVGAGVEGSEVFPVRQAYIPSGNYEQYFPSDLYYADIYDGEGGFSSWDNDSDGKHAEISGPFNDIDAMDMYPDVYLGKLPCNNEAEVTTIVDKIIKYEEHNMMTNKIVQIGGDTFPGDPQEINEGEFANGKVLEKLSGYTSIKLWASETQGADSLTKQNIANGFNGNVDFVDFSGHGSYASWATHAPEDEETWLPPKSYVPPSPYTGWLYLDYDLFMVSNTEKHPVVVFNACSCSKYSDTDTCMSWKTIRDDSGGIASFGASGIGYGSYGTHEVERVWGWMEVNLFEALYNEKELGKVWANTLNKYINSFIEDEWDGSDFKTICEMAMFGDPTLVIEDGKDPRSHNIQNMPQNYPLLEKLSGRLSGLGLLIKILAQIKTI